VWHTAVVAPPVLRDHYSAAEFRFLIDRESDRMELKTGAGGKSLQEALVAFSNTDGGLIFIGVDNDRQVVGRSLDQGTDDQIHRAAAVDAHNVGRYRIRQITVGQVPVVVVEVSRREDGFAQTSDGRILVRRGARDQPLIGDDVWRLASSRTLQRFERSSAGVRRGQVDGELLQRVCAAYGWDAAVVDLDDRLRERGLLRDDDELTVAGALVLTDPAQTLNASKLVVEIRWYEGAGPDPRRRMTIGGPLPEQVSTAAQLVIDELGSDLIVTGIHRRDLPRLPSVVVREAIANAVAHRSYERDQSAIIIEIRPHQVVVTSPGPLPEGVTVATMRHAQAARNPSVIAVLRQFRLTEDAGRGVDVMQDVMRDEMLDPPIFEEISDFVRVTLPIKGPITPQERAWLKDLEERGTLEPADRLLLVHATRRHPVTKLERRGGKLLEVGKSTMPRRLTNAEAREITGLGREEARTALKRLCDQGFLTQHGQRGGAYYLLNPTLIQGAAHGMTEEEIEQLVLGAAKQQAIRNEDVRRLTGLDSTAVGSMLRRLTERGLLERRGEKRGTEYVHTVSDQC
jgi:ATP-dependent DNA helicase RecG